MLRKPCLYCGLKTIRKFEAQLTTSKLQDFFLCKREFCIFDYHDDATAMYYDQGTSDDVPRYHEHYHLANQASLTTVKRGMILIVSILKKLLNKLCGKKKGDVLDELLKLAIVDGELMLDVRYRAAETSNWRIPTWYYIPDFEPWFQAIKKKVHEVMQERAMQIALCLRVPDSYRNRRRAKSITRGKLKGYKFFPVIKKTFVKELHPTILNRIWDFVFPDCYNTLYYYDDYYDVFYSLEYSTIARLKPGREMQGIIYSQVEVSENKEDKRKFWQSVRKLTQAQVTDAIFSKYTLKSV